MNRNLIQLIANPSRRGVSSLEVLVAFTLLSTLLGISTSLMVKHGRIVHSQRQYRIALDELSNQFEILSALPADEVEDSIENLQPSEFAARHLPGAQLKVDAHAADPGQRITLRLWWDEPQRKEAPVTLVGWVMPSSRPAPPTASEGDSR